MANFSNPECLTALEATAKQGKIKRVCIQALNYPQVFAHLEALVEEIKKQTVRSSFGFLPATQQRKHTALGKSGC